MASRVDSRVVALISVFAALYAAGTFLPGFPLIGVSGSSISLVRALEASYGLVLGPVYGPLAAFLGAFIGKTLIGDAVGLWLTPLAAASSFVAACLGRRRVAGVPGWALGSSVLAALIALWYATGIGLTIPLYATPHIAALCLALAFRGRTAEYIESGSGGKLVLGVAIVSFVGTWTGHIAGGLISVYVIGMSPSFFFVILPVSIVERTVITAISTAIGVPLVLAVRRFFPELRRL